MTAPALVAAMQARYSQSWYHTATFTQKTTKIDAEGKRTEEIWYEALEVPGKLRIDFAPMAAGSGMLFAGDVVSSFKAGALDSARPLVHPLMLLGFDIYRLPPAEVLKKLADLKIDLSIVRADAWQGRPSWVVGAKAGDLKSPQFWIDQQDLYFTRLIRPSGASGAQTSETQFNKYVKLGGGWIAPEVIFMVDGRVTTIEEYTELRADPKLDPRIFNPEMWKTARWSPEHARLAAMAGTWDVEMTFIFNPTRPGVTTKATSTIRALFDGTFIEERIEGTLNGAPFTTLAWTGFNTDSKKYEATRIASTNTARIAETGTFDEKTGTFELKADYPLAGDTWHQRTVIQHTSPDTMTAASYLSFGTVPEWKGVEIKYTRRR